MYLFARVSGIGSAATSGNAPIRIYPVDDDLILKLQEVVSKDTRVTSREDLHKAAVTEVQFWADPKVWTIGSLLWGDVKVLNLEDLQSYDPGDPTGKTLVPRILTDPTTGSPVLDQTGGEQVCKRATVQLVPGIRYVRAIPAEEAAQEVAELPFAMVA